MSRSGGPRRVPNYFSYRDLLRLPGAAAFFLPAAAARLGAAMMSFGVLWAVQGATGSFAVAGLATGCFAAAEALLAPQIARSVDSQGQRRLALMLVPIFAISCIALMVGGHLAYPVPVMVAASAVAGGSCPQVGSFSAARWRFITDGTDRMPRALALESLTNEIGFMVGPALVVVLSATVEQTLGLACAAGLLSGGTLLMTRRSDTEPPKETRGPGVLCDTRLLRRTFVGFPLLHMALGAYFATAPLALAAADIDHEAPGLAGVIAALGGAVSLVTGFAYGTRAEKSDPVRTMSIFSLVMGLLLILLSVVTGMFPLIALYALAAGCIPPMLISAAMLLQRTTPAGVYVQAISWTGSASAAGSAVAAPLIGALIDAESWRAGFVAAAVVIAGIPLIVLLFRRPTAGDR